MDMAIKTVMNLHDFVPSPDVNAAFSGLVAAVVQATALPTWCDDEVCREVQRRCSLSESEMEMYWSQRITSSARPQQELETFWYIDNYRELVRREIGLMGGSGLMLSNSSRVAMIGSGPLPLTAWCLWCQTGAAVDLVDVAPAALVQSRELARAIRLKPSSKLSIIYCRLSDLAGGSSCAAPTARKRCYTQRLTQIVCSVCSCWSSIILTTILSIRYMYIRKVNMKNKIALYLVNGALGAGKTTLVDFLVQQPEFAGARVIENEFASESIDSCTLAQRVDELATIAGECICCSSGEELVDILHNFAISGRAPVIIESTGVANTLRVVEKLLAGDVFEQYDLKQSLYVVDGAEARVNGLAEMLLAEAQAADVVLLSKLDLLTDSSRQQLIETLSQKGLTNVMRMDHGVCDLAQLGSQSQILDYLLLHEPAENAAENALNYSVVDMAELAISAEKIENIWASLRDKYALRRMKGAVADGDEIFHIEATPQQIWVTRGSTDESLKLVVIGERAREITRAVIMKELG